MTLPAPGVPEGYHTVCPYLIVPDADRVIAFLKAAFGATEREVYRTPEGRVRHAEVQIGDSVVMLGESSEEWSGFKAMIHLYMPEVDAVFRRAVAAGGRVVREVATQDYGDRTGGVEDPAGNQWWIATRTAEEAGGGDV
jgi:PhnB protein